MKPAILFSLMLAACAPSYAQVFGKNLIVNGDAEAGPGGDGKTRVSSIPGWTTDSGVPDVYAYATAYQNIHALSPNDIVPFQRGNNYFAGGSAKAASALTQTIDVSSAAVTVDSGTVRYALSAYCGGFGSDSDRPVVAVTFQDSQGTPLSPGDAVGAGTPERPPGFSGMYFRRNLGTVPVGTRKILITLTLLWSNGVTNEASADNLSLILTPKSTPDALLGVNLIVNPGADAAPGYNTALPIPTSADLPGWVRTPYFAADSYTDPGGDLTASTPGPSDRGANYFYGGTNVSNAGTHQESGVQLIDLSSLADLIDASNLQQALAGWLGGYSTQGDNAELDFIWSSATGTQLGNVNVTGPSRGGTTELLSIGAITLFPPVGTRTLSVKVAITRTDGTNDDGLADSLGIVFTRRTGATCTYTLGTTSFNPASGASTPGNVTVTPSAGGCQWTAYASDPWIVVTSAASNTGNGSVAFTLAANVGAPRNGFITIAGKTFNITQPSFTPSISVNRSSLNFGYAGATIITPQSELVTFSGGAQLAWTATSNVSNITLTPASGTGTGTFQVAPAPGPSGVVTITAPGASNSPLQIQVNIASVTPAPPFGSFDTPADNTSGIAGAIAISGWALDKILVSTVGIWREKVGSEPVSSNGLVFIGNATLVADARPDVLAANPTVPWNYRAGWGYLLLTNFLPNTSGTGPLGNGTYKLHVIAVDQNNLITDLGTRTIIVDNAHANKPFGTIDTPSQGGSASGNQFVNFGWALTPTPACIPNDGSTITVTVDGVTLGHPVYNQARSDISTAFPGYCNSGGAVGYFFVDTTKLANGVHTIGWLAYDNQGRGDGLGSRFFNVLNAGATAAPEVPFEWTASEDIRVRRLEGEPVTLKRNEHGEHVIEVEELGRIELHAGAIDGYQLVNGERAALPIGSTIQGGVFYWQLGPGFLGNYDLVLNRTDGEDVHLRVTVGPPDLVLK